MRRSILVLPQVNLFRSTQLAPIGLVPMEPKMVG
jgi:hypothetical protein